MKLTLIPSNLAEKTELLEALDWDEDALFDTLDMCQSVLEQAATESEAATSLMMLQSILVETRGEIVAKLAISLYLKSVIQQTNEGFEA